MPERRSLRSRTSLTSQVEQAPASAPAPAAMARPRRNMNGSNSQSVTVARATSRSPDDAKKSIRLTVKMPSSKLREATSGSSPIAAVNPRDNLDEGEIMSGPRSSRAKRSIVVESDSEEEDEGDDAEDAGQSEDERQEDDDDEQEEDGDDAEEEEEDEEEEPEEGDDGEDAEEDSVDVVADVDVDTDADAEGNMEIDDALLVPHPPVLKMTGPTQKPSLTITPAEEESESAAATKKMDLADDDDEELSELDSEGEEDDAEDAEGDEVGEMDEMDQDDEDPSQQIGSRASTPDVSKMTKRQRSRLDQVMGSDFLQLPMEPQIKKHLTAEEHAMRRAEMARRRKNLSEKRNEEEKMDTINRLLKKQAPKRRGKLSAAEISANAAAHEDLGSELEIEKPNPVFVRWVSDRHGCRVGVPGEWLAGPAGKVFGGGGGGSGGIEMVEG